MSSLLEALRANAGALPDNLACAKWRDGHIVSSRSYRELDTRARAVAGYLQTCTAPGDRVLLCFPQGTEFIDAFFGCLYAGVIAVPAFPPRRSRSFDRLGYIIRDCGASVALTTVPVLARVEAYMREASETPILCSAVEEIPDAASDRLERTTGDSLAFLQYTSGSTSNPKGVMVSHANLAANLRDLRRRHYYTPETVSVSWLPVFHDMGLIYGILLPIWSGFPAYFLSPEDFVRRPVSWLKALAKLRGTHTASPNFGYELCITEIGDGETDGLDLSCVVAMMNAAEPVRKATMSRFHAKFAHTGLRSGALCAAYGLAEATLKVTIEEVGAAPRFIAASTEGVERGHVVALPNDALGARDIASCGVPMPETEVAIVDSDKIEVCPEGRVGEIWVSGPGVARGYWRQPEATTEVFGARLPGDGRDWLRTGDLGFLYESRLYVTGRKKDLIILRGRNHYPQDIEQVVQQCSPAFRAGRGAAFSIDSETREELIIVQELNRRKPEPEYRELFAAINNAVFEASGTQPDAIALIRYGSLPVTSSGKVQRSAARAAFLSNRLDVVSEWRRGQSAAPAPVRGQDFSEWLVGRLAARLGIPVQDIEPDEPFARYGVTSVVVIQLAADISSRTGSEFDPSLFYEYRTVNEVAGYISGSRTAKDLGEPLRAASAVAVIGMACRFPRSDGTESFWRMLEAGVDAVRDVPETRQDLRSRFAGAELPRAGGYLEQIDEFDTALFRISPREADLIDPQQRLLLETTWEALENASWAADDRRGAAVGVFIGISGNDYGLIMKSDVGIADPSAATGISHSIAANRLSYLFDWNGPSLAIDTACSSSLVAVHQACVSLQRGDCEAAVAGGVNLVLDPEITAAFRSAGMLAPDAKCKTFDGEANGYVRGEGCGMVILKPLEGAVRDGDRVLAVIRGSAVNHNGRSNGITAPSSSAQQALIEAALQAASMQPEELSLIEAHGTGTQLGDPVEIRALLAVVNRGTRRQPCRVGAVKTNIGHLEAAAGIAGLIKTILSLQHKRIPPNLHWSRSNPHFPPMNGLLRFPIGCEDWAAEGRRVAGVSSFGFGGANAHVIVEEAPETAPRPSTPPRPAALLTISGETAASLRQNAIRWLEFLQQNPEFDVTRIGYYSNVARAHLKHRLCIVGTTNAQLALDLKVYLEGGPSSVQTGVIRRGNPPRTAFCIDAAAGAAGEAYAAMWRSWGIAGDADPGSPDVQLIVYPGDSPDHEFENTLERLGALYVQGAEIKWRAVNAGLYYPVIDLPCYAFDRQRCWFSSVSKAAAVVPSLALPPVLPVEAAEQKLAEIIASALRLEPAEIDRDARFIEMGADSIVLVNAIRQVEAKFGIRLAIRQLFEETPDIRRLARYLAEHTSTPPAMVPQLLPLEDSDGLNSNGLKGILLKQSEAVRQLAVAYSELAQRVDNGAARPHGAEVPAGYPEEASPRSALPPWKASAREPARAERQQVHLSQLITRYTAKTRKSKVAAQDARRKLADNRASAGFRFSTKEMLYPLVVDRAYGSRFEDIDGNSYLDITMGFGVHLFGHAPDFLVNALEAELRRGAPLGPQTRLAGEVAELVHRITGMDRVYFCNTGTEAVMTALRLARAATGRNRVVVFEGAYHGNFDGVLASAERRNGFITPVCMTPGTPPGMVEELIPLPYGSDVSLEIIRREGRNLAAVLVEPVQSRRPDLQPSGFLESLRALTRESGAVLIFDEMITGFRIVPGGAQQHFGIRADLATYGKIAGGGQPVGIVAGTTELMDRVDGGWWEFGDASYPQVENVFLAGTFNKHPLAMAAAREVLRRIADDGGTLHARLNMMTADLASTLNRMFDRSGMSIRVVHFGSLFRFQHFDNQDVFIYHLLEKGIFIWEGRNCFLSTAHSTADVEFLVSSVDAIISEMKRGGYFSPADGKTSLPVSLPLTEDQQQLRWLSSLGRGGSTAYNEAAAIRLSGAVDVTAMRRAIESVCARHEALLSRVDSATLQLESSPNPDWREVSVGDENAAKSAIADFVAEPFDFSAKPPFRARLFLVCDRCSYLVLCAHHIIVDGISMGLLVKEVGAMYTATVENRSAALSSPCSFADFLVRREIRAGARKANADYLASMLRRSPKYMELPADFQRPAVRTFGGAAVFEDLELGFANRVIEFSRSHRVTPYMAFLAPYLLLLHRLSGQEQIVAGIPVSGREDARDEDVVGFCSYMMPIASTYSGEQSMDSYLDSLRTNLLDIYEHQDFSFPQLLTSMQLPFDASRSPLFGAVFNLDHSEGLASLFPLAAAIVPIERRSSKFDISLNVTHVGNCYSLSLEYSSDLFTQGSARRILRQYVTLLDAFCSRSSDVLGRVDLMSAEERRLHIVERNATRRDVSTAGSVVEWFYDYARTQPDQAAVVCEDRRLSYKELAGRAKALARHLTNRGISRETPVGICLEPGADIPAAMLGVLHAGGFYVPMDPHHPRSRIERIVRDAGASCIITESRCMDQLRNLPAELIALDELDLSADEPLPLSETHPLQLAYMIHTSGSTGAPKGVAVSHGALLNLLGAMAETPGFHEREVLLSVTTLSFDIAALEILLPLVKGGTLWIAPQATRGDGVQLAALLAKSGADVMQATPATWRLLIDCGWNGVPTLRALCGGEALPPELARQLRPLVGSLWNIYGPTETTIWSSVREIRSPDQPIDLGLPVANTTLHVLDRWMHPVPVGVAGELYIGGAGVARGYHNRPGLTAERFVPDPFSTEAGARLYRTGDLVRLWDDSRLEYLGRIDAQVKINGHRIEPGEIVAALLTLPGVAQAAVVPRRGANGQASLAAFLVSSSSPKPAVTELRSALEAQLPRYMVPADFRFVEALPLTPNGKIDAGALARMDSTAASPAVPYAAPETSFERTLVRIWHSILGHDRSGIDDNFFDSGGNSLMLARMHTAVQRELGREFPLIDTLRFPNIRSLARHLGSEADPTTIAADFELDDSYRRAERRRAILKRHATAERVAHQ